MSPGTLAGRQLYHHDHWHFHVVIMQKLPLVKLSASKTLAVS